MTDNTDETLGETPTDWVQKMLKGKFSPIDSYLLIGAAAKLIEFAQTHDPDALTKILSLVNQPKT